MLRKALATLPRTLNETYARILCNIHEEYQQHALHILQWLNFSERLLEIGEIAEVLAIDVNDTPKFDPQRRLADPYDVVEICSSLVTVTTWRAYKSDYESYTVSTVRLAHFSVREYLTSEVIIQGQAWKFSLQELECHVSLAKDCLAYLLHFDEAITCSKEEVFAEYPLLLYAGKYLTEHARMAEKRDSTLCTDFFLERGEAFFNWIRLCNLDPYRPWRHKKPTLSSGSFASPLYYASLAGLLETVKTLCDVGADVNAIGGGFETALIAASCNERIEIATLLLGKGALVNSKSSRGTVLQRVVKKGSTEILRLLLEHGADVNISAPDHSGYLGTALQIATSAGHMEKAEMLLEYGADVNIGKNVGDTLLQDASSKPNTKIAQFLLKHGADVNIMNPSKGTALMMASFKENTGIVQLLLEHGADVNIVGPDGTTALQTASKRGYTEIVRLLLEYSADVNISGPCGTALQKASRFGWISIVQMLLEYGADVNTLGPGGTALWEASKIGYSYTTDMVRLLLEHGADVNISGPCGCTALQEAISTGHMEIAEMLREKGAEPLSYDA